MRRAYNSVLTEHERAALLAALLRRHARSCSATLCKKDAHAREASTKPFGSLATRLGWTRPVRYRCLHSVAHAPAPTFRAITAGLARLQTGGRDESTAECIKNTLRVHRDTSEAYRRQFVIDLRERHLGHIGPGGGGGNGGDDFSRTEIALMRNGSLHHQNEPLRVALAHRMALAMSEHDIAAPHHQQSSRHSEAHPRDILHILPPPYHRLHCAVNPASAGTDASECVGRGSAQTDGSYCPVRRLKRNLKPCSDAASMFLIVGGGVVDSAWCRLEIIQWAFDAQHQLTANFSDASEKKATLSHFLWHRIQLVPNVTAVQWELVCGDGALLSNPHTTRVGSTAVLSPALRTPPSLPACGNC